MLQWARREFAPRPRIGSTAPDVPSESSDCGEWPIAQDRCVGAVPTLCKDLVNRFVVRKNTPFQQLAVVSYRLPSGGASSTPLRLQSHPPPQPLAPRPLPPFHGR